jgi:hypothetical protein
MISCKNFEEESVQEVKAEYKVEEVFSLDDSKTFQELKEGEEMNFSEVLEIINKLEDPRKQLEELHRQSVKFSGAESSILETLIKSKESEALAFSKAEESAHRATLATQEAARLKETNIRLSTDLVAAKEGSWSNKVQAYASKLRTDGHHESAVKTVEGILSKMKTEAREQKFSLIDTEEPMDVIAILTEVFDSMPKTARLNTEEVTSANQSVEVIPEVTEVAPEQVRLSTESASKFESKSEELSLGCQIFHQKNGYLPGKDVWPFIKEDGNIDWDSMN